MNILKIYTIIVSILLLAYIFGFLMIERKYEACKKDKNELANILSECQYLLTKLVEPYIEELKK